MKLRLALALTAALMLCAPAAHAAWPVKPLNAPHVIRGSFQDARGTSFHHGVDIPVDDAHPESGAPSWASHRVYAIANGTVSYQAAYPTAPTSECTQNRTAVGSFIYYHVVTSVRSGSYVRRGQMIGWTCRGRWHVHVTEGFGANPLNPLRPGAALGPYRNPLAPTVSEIAAFSPCKATITERAGRTIVPACGTRLDLQSLHGTVDVRFEGEEHQPRTGLFALQPQLYAPSHPFAARVRIQRLTEAGKPVRTVYDREIWRAIHLLDGPPAPVRYAPGFARWLPLWACARRASYDACKGAYWYHALARREGSAWLRWWDTTSVPDGRYRITVMLTSLTGKRGAKSLDVRVTNEWIPEPTVEEPPVPEPEVFEADSEAETDAWARSVLAE
jgi:hypothetical protein